MDAVELQSRDPCSYMLGDAILQTPKHTALPEIEKFRYAEYTVA